MNIVTWSRILKVNHGSNCHYPEVKKTEDLEKQRKEILRKNEHFNFYLVKKKLTFLQDKQQDLILSEELWLMSPVQGTKLEKIEKKLFSFSYASSYKCSV